MSVGVTSIVLETLIDPESDRAGVCVICGENESVLVSVADIDNVAKDVAVEPLDIIAVNVGVRVVLIDALGVAEFVLLTCSDIEPWSRETVVVADVRRDAEETALTDGDPDAELPFDILVEELPYSVGEAVPSPKRVELTRGDLDSEAAAVGLCDSDCVCAIVLEMKEEADNVTNAETLSLADRLGVLLVVDVGPSAEKLLDTDGLHVD